MVSYNNILSSSTNIIFDSFSSSSDTNSTSIDGILLITGS